MSKSPSRAPRTKVRELEAFAKRKVNAEKFATDIPAAYWKEFFSPFGDISSPAAFFVPIETLGPTKTVGKGRTNLTIIRPTILQADATTPYVGFDRRESPSRNPGIQMHFEPGAYGITSAATYVMVFAVETFGPATFNVSGGPVIVTNTGTRGVNGKASLSLVFHNVQPTQPVYGYIEQTAGEAWNCYSVRVRYPALVLTP